jgi:hypothetical protein
MLRIVASDDLKGGERHIARNGWGATPRSQTGTRLRAVYANGREMVLSHHFLPLTNNPHDGHPPSAFAFSNTYQPNLVLQIRKEWNNSLGFLE